MGLTEVKKS